MFQSLHWKDVKISGRYSETNDVVASLIDRERRSLMFLATKKRIYSVDLFNVV